MANLLEQLRATGEEILDAALPTPQELPKIIAALTAHLEQNVPNIGKIALEALEHRKEPEPSADLTGAEPAASPIVSEPAAPETPEQLKARLEAELANANAQAPAVTSHPAP